MTMSEAFSGGLGRTRMAYPTAVSTLAMSTLSRKLRVA
jgi:hypothetical protein